MEVRVTDTFLKQMSKLIKHKPRKTVKQKAEHEKKVKEYTHFLKDDADWDWDYILRLLRYKLQRTRHCIASGSTVNRARTAAEIKEVEDLLWKVLEHDYHSEAFKEFYRKHGKPKHRCVECVPPNKHATKLEITYRNGKESTEAMGRECRKLAKKEFDLQKSDLRKAFKIMVEKIWGWWD